MLEPWLLIVALSSAQCFSESKGPVLTNISRLCHSIRQGGKVRQQVFGTLGRLDELRASGRLEALMRSGAASL
jgi:hypothetical protein